ncbi:MAG: phage tail tape measure protein [Synergistaceae bacterium]|nr:phage tail tape measure protein [Synergistaceae bacterium]
MAKAVEISFAIGAALTGGFTGAFGKAGQALSQLQKQASSMQKQTGQISQYQKMQGSIAQTSEKLNAARARVKELGLQMKATAQPTEAMKKQFTQANIEAHKLQESLGNQRKKLGELRSELSGAGIDTRKLASEQLRLAEHSQKVTQAQEKLARSQAALKETQSKLSWDNIKGELMTSAALGLSMAKPVQQAADFQQAMARVNAVAFTGKNKTPEQQAADQAAFEALQKQARQLGRDTQYTATQAAQSQENLARAGFKSQEIIAAMPGLLSMAAAEGMDLAQAADIAASTLRGFNLSADQSNRVADVLAQTSAASNTSITGLGESMKYVAPVMSGLGVSVEETAAMLGIMGNAGIKGSQAGTALRAAFLRLSKEPKAVSKALAQLGIAAKDSQGKLRTMPSLMKELSQKMKGMGEGEQMKYLSNIFGSEAAAGMLAIMRASVDGSLAELEKLNKGSEGVAKQMADTMNNTLTGAFTRLGSATESLMIDIGNVLLPTVQSAVDQFANWTAGLSALAQEYPIVTKVLVGGVAAISGYKVAVTGLKIAWNLTKLPFQHVRVALDWLNAKMLMSGHSSIWAAAKTKVLTTAQKAWGIVMKTGRKLLDVGKLALYYGKQILITTATKAWTAAQWLWNAALNANPIGLLITAIAGAIAIGYAMYKNWDKIKAWWNSWKVKDIFAVIKDYASKAWNYAKEKWNDFWAWWDSLELGDLFSPVKEFASGAYDWVKAKWEEFKSWWNSWTLEDIFPSLKEYAASAKDFVLSKWESFKSWWDSWTLADIFPSVKEYAGSAKDYVLSKWQDFSNWWNSFTLADIFTEARTYAASAKDFVLSTWQDFKDWWFSWDIDDIFSAIGGYASTAKEFALSTWQSFSDWWNSWTLDDVFSGTKSYTGIAKDYVSEKWQEFNDWWNSWTLEDVFAIAKDYAGMAKDFVLSKWQDFSSWWNSWTLADIFPGVKKYADLAEVHVQNKWQDFSNWWQSWTLEDVFAIAKDYAGSAKDFTLSKWEEFLTWWDSLNLKDVFEIVSGYAEIAQGYVSSKWEEFKSWWESITLSDLFAPIVQFAVEKVEQLRGVFMNFCQWLKDLFAKLNPFNWQMPAWLGGGKAGDQQVKNAEAAVNSWGIPNINKRALGGFINRPELSLIGEAGREVVVPLENRARGIPLWRAAGEELGFSFGNSTTTNNNRNVTMSPNINITVNGGDGNTAQKFRQIVEDVLSDLQDQERRLSFA